MTSVAAVLDAPSSPDGLLGVHWDGSGVRFGAFSRHAEKIELCLFDKTGRHETDRVTLSGDGSGQWQGYVAGLGPGQLYGFRAHGPYEPRAGHRFNPNKLLLDPCARELSGPIVDHDLQYGYEIGHPDLDLTYDRRDSAAAMPKCRVVDQKFDWGDDRPPVVARADMVIYELNVRGMTMLHPDVRPAGRGRFAGLASPAVIDHLLRLGVTSVELMPITPVVTARPIACAGLHDYWGYNPAVFGAVDPRYAPDGVAEFKAVVRAFHAAGLQVIVDMVFNHSGEGGHLGPTLSFRGLDNASYYRLVPGDERHYADLTGCRNTLSFDEPQVVRLALETMRYWTSEMRVDGFRLDLATTLARRTDHYDTQAPLLAAIARDPVLSRAVLIAEPWDFGHDGYQLGNFPDGWMEWNDRYRDTVRRFWRGDPGQLADLATRLAGSSDVFPENRGPLAGVNFVTAHDGFTLEDLVTYTRKHNGSNREGGADGTNANYSSNCGKEGPTTSDDVLHRRARRKRNLIATLFMSAGIPMLSAGDEMGRTQHGNNNAYCQDNPTSWLDWSERPADAGGLLEFFVRMANIRKDHPVLRRAVFFDGVQHEGEAAADIVWLTPSGVPMTQEHWHDADLRCFGFVAYRKSPDSKEDWLVVVVNGSPGTVPFVLPQGPADAVWECSVDTARETLAMRPAAYAAGEACVLEGESFAVFAPVQLSPGDE